MRQGEELNFSVNNQSLGTDYLTPFILPFAPSGGGLPDLIRIADENFTISLAFPDLNASSLMVWFAQITILIPYRSSFTPDIWG